MEGQRGRGRGQDRGGRGGGRGQQSQRGGRGSDRGAGPSSQSGRGFGGGGPSRGRGFGQRPPPLPSSKNYPPVNPVRIEKRIDGKTACKSKPKFVARPGQCNLGRPIDLVTNHFALRIPEISVFHYDFQIKVSGRTGQSPKPPKQTVQPAAAAAEDAGQSKAKFRKLKQSDHRKILDELTKQRESHFKDKTGRKITVVYDGEKNIITPVMLPAGKRKEFTETISVNMDESERTDLGVPVEGRWMDFEVKVKYVQTIDLSLFNRYYDSEGVTEEPMREVFQAIDIIFRHGPTKKRVPIGQSLYLKEGDGVGEYLGPNKEIRFGHYQAFHMTQSGPTLNVDRSASAFYKKGTLLEFIGNMFKDYQGRSRFDPNRRQVKQEMNKLNDLKKLRVYSLHLNYKRSYVINGFDTQTSDERKFELKDNKKKVTVKEYFESTYKDKLTNNRLKYPNLPCIIPQGGKTNYIPMELLYVYPDQRVPRKDMEKDTATIVRVCGQQTPVERFGEIQQAVENVKNDSLEILSEFRIEMSTNPLQLTGRVIPKPTSQGLDNNKGFKSPQELARWAFIDMSYRGLPEPKVKEFIEDLIKEGRRLKMNIAQPKIVQAKLDDIESHFIWAKSMKCQLLMFVIDENSNYRPEIKFHGDVVHGVATQCVKSGNCFKDRNKIHFLLLFKINAKIGGINRSIDGLSFCPMKQPKQIMIDMIIGADVAHPAPGSALPSSVAAMVGTFNSDYFKYFATVSVQQRSSRRNAVEMIIESGAMFETLLNNFYKNNKRWPKTILYYRDGVSDSQFSQVLEYECDKMKKVYHNLTKEQPKMTFVTVQKRHHTRFKPANERDGTGPKKNVPPGTTVDSGVVHPTDFDFYLTSHNGIQGTSRPTRYYVLQDDNGFSANDLERLTYHLCYNYSRCETPISIPPPVQYAHLTAARAKDHIVSRLNEAIRVTGDTEMEQFESEKKIAMELNKWVQVKYKDSMYFS